MNITFIGGGNMATAIIGGLIRENFDRKLLSVVEVQPEPRAQLKQQFGIATYASGAELPAGGDIVVLAVKPQQMRVAVEPLIPKLHRQVVLSIAAGIRIANLSRWLGGYNRIIRCMPNTPALIGAGITAACAAPAITSDERGSAEHILKSIGKVVWVDDESLLDPVTAVSGSGPAYAFYFIEALRDAGTKLGLNADTANLLAIETFAGAAKLALQSTEDVSTLRQRVTSKGGTTEAALTSMAHDQLGAIMRAVEAASARGRELGDELGRDG